MSRMAYNTSVNVPVARKVAERPSPVTWRSRVRHVASSEIGPQVTSSVSSSLRRMPFHAACRAVKGRHQAAVGKYALVSASFLCHNTPRNVPASLKVALVACFSGLLKIGSQVTSPALPALRLTPFYTVPRALVNCNQVIEANISLFAVYFSC